MSSESNSEGPKTFVPEAAARETKEVLARNLSAGDSFEREGAVLTVQSVGRLGAEHVRITFTNETTIDVSADLEFDVFSNN